jgi:hypothetical protein
MTLSQDRIGLCKLLDDGRVLRIQERMHTVMLKLCESQASPTWLERW